MRDKEGRLVSGHLSMKRAVAIRYCKVHSFVLAVNDGFSKARDPVRRFAWSAADRTDYSTFEMAAPLAPSNLH